MEDGSQDQPRRTWLPAMRQAGPDKRETCDANYTHVPLCASSSSVGNAKRFPSFRLENLISAALLLLPDVSAFLARGSYNSLHGEASRVLDRSVDQARLAVVGMPELFAKVSRRIGKGMCHSVW